MHQAKPRLENVRIFPDDFPMVLLCLMIGCGFSMVFYFSQLPFCSSSLFHAFSSYWLLPSIDCYVDLLTAPRSFRRTAAPNLSESDREGSFTYDSNVNNSNKRSPSVISTSINLRVFFGEVQEAFPKNTGQSLLIALHFEMFQP